MGPTFPAARSFDSSPASDCSYQEKGFYSRRDGPGKRSVGRFVRQVFSAGEEPDERTPLLRDVIENRAGERRVPRLQGIENGSLRDWRRDLELHFAGDLRQDTQMRRKHDADHARVCTSTDTTAGRSRTMGVQLSPPLGEA